MFGDPVLVILIIVAVVSAFIVQERDRKRREGELRQLFAPPTDDGAEVFEARLKLAFLRANQVASSGAMRLVSRIAMLGGLLLGTLVAQAFIDPSARPPGSPLSYLTLAIGLAVSLAFGWGFYELEMRRTRSEYFRALAEAGIHPMVR